MIKTTPPEIAQIQDRCVVDRVDFEWWLDQKRWTWQQIARGEIGLTIEQVQLLYVSEDPVLWCRAFMDEPDKPGTPYEFFDYQIESARAWFQNVIHQDGAEVGKTREIVALTMWGECTGFGGSIQNPWMLIAAPQQTHLDEIIMAIEEHVGEEEGHSGRKPLINRFWRKPKKHPHYMMRFRGPMGPGRVYFRPAGHDGEAFRGVHVNAGGYFDEAAKVKNKVIWSEFFRALKPGCPFRGYSVPDGDNATEFYRMTQKAVPNLPPDKDGLRLFHWPKTIMPHPFWSEERRREFIDRFGSEDAPGYVRNVLGLHGQQENPVWPWDVIEPNLRDVPEYRCLRLTGDNTKGDMHVEAYRIELSMNDNRKNATRHYLADRYDSLAPFKSKNRDEIRAAVRKLLRQFFDTAPKGVYWAGGDLGYSKDPTELMIWQEVGAELRRAARINMRGLGYDVQCEVIFCLDELFGFQPSWGVDFGSAGTAVVQMLQSLEQYAEGNYEERLTGFQFASALDAIDEEGNILEEEDKRDGEPKPLRLPAKEWATEVLTKRMQRMTLTMPFDQDVVNHYTNHTARQGARWRIFSKDNDHTIDADRVMILRKIYNEAVGGVDVFVSSAHKRSAA